MTDEGKALKQDIYKISTNTQVTLWKRRAEDRKKDFKMPYFGQNTAIETMNSQQPWMFPVSLHKNGHEQLSWMHVRH